MGRWLVAWWALALALSGVVVGVSAAKAETKTLRIAMIVWRGETAAEAGFRDGLKKLGYTVDITVIDAGQDRTVLRDRFEKTVMPHLDHFDYIYSFGTTATKMIKDLVGDKVPILFNAIAAPAGAGIVQSLEAPGGNISGASNAVALQTQIQAAMKLFPIKKLGLLFNPREKNAMIQRDRLTAIAKQYGFEVVDLRAPPAQDMLQKNLQQLADKSVAVDAVYLPADSFLISEADAIGAGLRAAKVKSIGAVKQFVSAGALMGTVPDYHELGMAVAGILDRSHKGEKLASIPVYVTQEPSLVINERTRAELGFKVPAEILQKAEVVN